MKMRSVLPWLLGLLLLLCACGTPAAIPAPTLPQAEPGEEILVEADPGLPPVPEADPFAGRYEDENCNTVLVEKKGGDYTMEVSIYRLTSLSEGRVTPRDGGLAYATVDANGEPMTVFFSPAEDGSFTLLVEESTWPLLEAGTVFENLQKIG